MSELTNPEGGVQQETPSFESRISALLDVEEHAEPGQEQEQSEQQEQPSDQVASDELTPDDIPEEQVVAQSTVDEFEIVHEGQQHKLTRADTIKLAQQGFDYTKNMQALARDREAVQANVRRSQEMVSLAPMVAQDLATVRALEAQLSQFQNADWVKLATDDPLDYPRVRAQYDTLVNAYQGAVGQLQRNAGQLQHHQQALAQHSLQAEAVQLRRLVPEWADNKVYEKEAPDMARYLMDRGVPANMVDALGQASGDSVLVAIARDAWLYSRLKADKANKVKQLRTAPPVTRPGTPAPAQADQAREARDRLKKTGDRFDAARLIATQIR